MKRYTPGPWRLGSPGGGRLCVTNPIGDIVCSVEGGRATDTANARLIAAAPDMLDALKALREELSDRYDGAPDAGLDWMAKHLAALEGAIAKAEGK